MYDATLSETLTKEDRYILADTYATSAEGHLDQQREPSYPQAIDDATRLCEALGVQVNPTPNTFSGDRQRIALAYGYALRAKRSLQNGERVAELPLFVEGLCKNLGIHIEDPRKGEHIGAIMKHVTTILGK